MKKIVLVLIISLLFTGSAFANSSGFAREVEMEGYIIQKSADSIRIEEYNGSVHLLTYDQNTKFIIDNIYVDPIDFRVGMEVLALVKGNRISSIESYSTDNPGYISPGRRVVNGIVSKIDRDQIILELPTGETKSYFTTPATIALRKGTTVPLNVLYVGDRVRLFFDNIDTDIISRIQIQGESVTVREIYKGNLGVVDSIRNEVNINGLRKLVNGKWETVKSSVTLPYSHDLKIYFGGYTIPYYNLEYYRGKEVYIAVKEFFGFERIERMVIKSQYETSYIEKIDEINWFSGLMELSNKKNIGFNEGTIIVKNGRLVDQYSINPGSDAFIAADGRSGEMTADVVFIYNEDINNSNIGQNHIYGGRLEEATSGRVVLRDFFLLDMNEWVSFQGEKELYFDSDTEIIDSESGRVLSEEEFLTGYYAVDESTKYVIGNKLKDWFAYVYTDGDRIACITLQKNRDSLLNQRISNGIIASTTEDPLVGWTISLANCADWSRRNEKWMLRSQITRISTEKAIIIKDGKTISNEELLTGDRLYIVRDDFLGKIIIVK